MGTALRLDFRKSEVPELAEGDGVELVAGEKKAATPAPAAVRPAGSIADDPLVKEAMNRFDATNVRVTPRGRG